jgi:hypothetical protein
MVISGGWWSWYARMKTPLETQVQVPRARVGKLLARLRLQLVLVLPRQCTLKTYVVISMKTITKSK